MSPATTTAITRCRIDDELAPPEVETIEVDCRDAPVLEEKVEAGSVDFDSSLPGRPRRLGPDRSAKPFEGGRHLALEQGGYVAGSIGVPGGGH